MGGVGSGKGLGWSNLLKLGSIAFLFYLAFASGIISGISFGGGWGILIIILIVLAFFWAIK